MGGHRVFEEIDVRSAVFLVRGRRSGAEKGELKEFRFQFLVTVEVETDGKAK
jgi:hypothetical protein